MQSNPESVSSDVRHNATAGSPYVDEFIGSVAPSIVSGAFSGMIVCFVTLWLTGRQRVAQEKRARAMRRTRQNPPLSRCR